MHEISPPANWLRLLKNSFPVRRDFPQFPPDMTKNPDLTAFCELMVIGNPPD
jgi:hypothetical protein